MVMPAAGTEHMGALGAAGGYRDDAWGKMWLSTATDANVELWRL